MRKMNLPAREVLMRARQRGYDERAVRECIVEDRGDRWVVDVDHPAYPRDRSLPAPPPVPPKPSGPGTELKALLRKIGITASPNCSCNRRAAEMDRLEAQEPGWCLANIETICDWLQEEATKRKLPFLRTAGKLLIRRAVSNARKKGQ